MQTTSIVSLDDVMRVKRVGQPTSEQMRLQNLDVCAFFFNILALNCDVSF
jgi:hypothetical protein